MAGGDIAAVRPHAENTGYAERAANIDADSADVASAANNGAASADAEGGGGGTMRERSWAPVPAPAAWAFVLGGALYSVGTGLRWFAPGYDMGARLDDRMSPIVPGSPELTAPGSVAFTAAGLLVLAAAWVLFAFTRERGPRRWWLALACVCSAANLAMLGVPTAQAGLTGAAVAWPNEGWLGYALLPAVLGLPQLVTALLLVSRPNPPRITAACLFMVTPVLPEYLILSAVYPSHDDPGGFGLVMGTAYVGVGFALLVDRAAWHRTAPASPAVTDTWDARAHRFAWAGWVLVAAGAVAAGLSLAPSPDPDRGPSPAVVVLSLVPLVLAGVAAVLAATGPWVRGRVAVVAAAFLCLIAALGQAVADAVLALSMPGSPLEGMSWEGREALAASPGVLAAAGLVVLFLLGWAHRAPGEAWHGNARAALVPIAAGLALTGLLAFVLQLGVNAEGIRHLGVMAPVGLLSGVPLVLAGRRRATAS